MNLMFLYCDRYVYILTSAAEEETFFHRGTYQIYCFCFVRKQVDVYGIKSD